MFEHGRANSGMKATNSPELDEALRAELRAWSLKAPLPPRFEEQVWQRIARIENSPESSVWAGMKFWIEYVLSRRSVAASYLALLLLLGLTTGYRRAHGTITQAEMNLRHRYVQTVDPYQMHRP